MSIQDLITAGRERSAGAWRIERRDDIAHLIHHGTAMLRWDVTAPRETLEVLSIGWGSVSDQNGCNTAFRAFGVELRYDRDRRGGGPRITDISAQLRAAGY